MLIEILSVYVNYLWRQTLTWELSDYNTLSRSCFHSDDNTTGVKKKEQYVYTLYVGILRVNIHEVFYSVHVPLTFFISQ